MVQWSTNSHDGKHKITKSKKAKDQKSCRLLGGCFSPFFLPIHSSPHFFFVVVDGTNHTLDHTDLLSVLRMISPVLE